MLNKIFLIIICTLGCNISYSDSEDTGCGAETWSKNCSRCHNSRPASEFSTQQWQTIIMHMRLQAGLTGHEERDIYQFLSAQSGGPQVVETAAIPTVPVPAPTIKLADATPAKTPAPAAATPTISGKSIYTKTCIACHGADGKGAIPGAPNFRDKNSPLNKSEAVLLQHIENGFQSPGSTMPMPPKGGNASLTKEQIKAVLDYMEQNFK